MHSPPNTIKETLNAQYEQNDDGEIQLNNYVCYYTKLLLLFFFLLKVYLFIL